MTRSAQPRTPAGLALAIVAHVGLAAAWVGLAAVPGGGCTFDGSGLLPPPCRMPADCPPGQECLDGRCLVRSCVVASDCGITQEFRCEVGQCRPVACEDGCGSGFECGTGGYCWSTTCVPATEGPPDSPSCADGLDNDCDGWTDADDIGCRRCEQHQDCDDGRRCNGVETCVGGTCVEGTPIACPAALTPCHATVCDDSVSSFDPCVDVAAPDGAPCDDTDLCTDDDVCDAGACVGRPRVCDDGVLCTADACDPGTGSCFTTPMDDRCVPSEVCRPRCFPGTSGCGQPPATLNLTCDSPAPVGLGSSCEVDLAGVAGQAACLDCVGMADDPYLSFCDFDDGSGACSLDGWAVAADSPCGVDDDSWCSDWLTGAPSLTVDKADCAERAIILEQHVNLLGIDTAEVCLAYADSGATGGNDFLRLEHDATGSGGALTQLFQDVDGPLPGVDEVWSPVCVRLPPEATGQPDVLLRLTLHSNDDNQRLFADNLLVAAHGTGCSSWSELFLSTFDGCDAAGWSLAGTVDCPGAFPDTLEANDTAKSWVIQRWVDTTMVDGDLVLFLDLAHKGTNAGDSLTVEVNVAGAWQTVFAQNGRLRSDDLFTTFLVEVSRQVPAATLNPDLGLRITASSSAKNHRIAIDNVALRAVRYTCDGSAVSLGVLADQGEGRYGFVATTALPRPAQIECTWGEDPARADEESIQFRP